MSPRRPAAMAGAPVLLRPMAPDSDVLAQAVERGPRHWRPIMADVQDGYTSLIVVSQGVQPFRPAPTRLPLILYIGDDLHRALGPGGFDKPSLREVISTCCAAVVVGCEPLYELYKTAAESASIARQNTVLIETRGEQEIPWVEFLRECRPDIGLLLGSVHGGNA